MEISESIKYVGVNDRKTDLFEGQYPVPNGISYNSYVILDEKTAVTDTVDADFFDEWISNVKTALSGRLPDYLVVHHMEPDHSANIKKFLEVYPETVVVASKKALEMTDALFGEGTVKNRLEMGDGSELSLGKHSLTFVSAPMVHWPEVLVSYEKCEKILFSADAFGKFGALDCDEEWDSEAARYYFGIVGKYGAQVQALFKKLAGFEIETICPLHGPVLKDSISHCLKLYDIWSSYKPEKTGVFIAYASVYGNTKKAAEMLYEKLKKSGETVEIADLARYDMSQAVKNAFLFDRLVLATPTYNSDVFPFMRDFISRLTERSYKGRTVGLIENGSWAPVAANVMKKMFEKSKDIVFLEPVVTVRSAVDALSESAVDALSKSLLNE